MTEECTDRCKLTQANWAEREAAFAAHWPNYCRECGGVGGQDIPPTRDDPPDWIDCEHCIGEGHCPRCKADLDEMLDPDGYLDSLWCQTCNWQLHDTHCWEHYVPEQPECVCWEEGLFDDVS